MEKLFIEGKDLLTVIREAKQRKRIWEAEMQVKLAEIKRQREEFMNRFDTFCIENNV